MKILPVSWAVSKRVSLANLVCLRFRCQTHNMHIFIALLLVSVCKRADSADLEYVYDVSNSSRLVFENSRQFRVPTGHIYHMEEDVNRDGFIMYSSNNSIRSTSGNTVYTIAGAGTNHTAGAFLDLRAFLQLNSTSILIADYRACLISIFDVEVSGTQDLAGEFNQPGYTNNDTASLARFRYPNLLLRHHTDTNIILVGDQGNRAIRSINLMSLEVSTFIDLGDYNLRGMCWFGDKLFVTHDHGYIYYDLTSSPLIIHQHNHAQPGFTDGALSVAEYSLLSDAVPLPNRGEVFIVADRYNNRLRVIDFEKNMVSSFCNRDLNASYPLSLVWSDGKLYTGQLSHISTYTVRETTEESTAWCMITTTPPPTTTLQTTTSTTSLPTTTANSSTTVITKKAVPVINQASKRRTELCLIWTTTVLLLIELTIINIPST